MYTYVHSTQLDACVPPHPSRWRVTRTVAATTLGVQFHFDVCTLPPPWLWRRRHNKHVAAPQPKRKCPHCEYASSDLRFVPARPRVADVCVQGASSLAIFFLPRARFSPLSVSVRDVLPARRRGIFRAHHRSELFLTHFPLSNFRRHLKLHAEPVASGDTAAECRPSRVKLTAGAAPHPLQPGVDDAAPLAGGSPATVQPIPRVESGVVDDDDASGSLSEGGNDEDGDAAASGVLVAVASSARDQTSAVHRAPLADRNTDDSRGSCDNNTCANAAASTAAGACLAAAAAAVDSGERELGGERKRRRV